MELKKYKPVINDNKEYTLQEASGGLYEELKMLMLKSAVTGTQEKFAIIKEFKLTKDFDKDELKKFQESLSKEEISVKEFYEKVMSVIFTEKINGVTFDKINLNQMSRAVSDFFLSASGT